MNSADRLHKNAQYPPKPALALQVGIVGHRPDRLQQADLQTLSSVIKQILGKVKETVHRYHSDSKNLDLFRDSAPILRAVSPMAEGSDRIFAEQALDLGYHLCCPMPFFQEEYEKDFDPSHSKEPDSLKRFRDLLERAKIDSNLTVFELDGNQNKKKAAYAAASKVLLSQSDILLSVWDGEFHGNQGGTEETTIEAKRQGIPVIRIQAQPPHSWEILGSDTSNLPKNRKHKLATILDKSNPWGDLEKIVKSFIALPSFSRMPIKNEKKHPRHYTRPFKAIQDFLCEQKPASFVLSITWKCFRAIFGDGKMPQPEFGVKNVEEAVLAEWPRDESTAVAHMINRLRPYFAWPDQLAIFYGNTYRGAFISSYLLAAAAVGLALWPLAAGWFTGSHHLAETICILSELFVILIILALVSVGRLKRWHERWIDYRLAAEFFRHIRLVSPLGGSHLFPQMPAHLSSYGSLPSTWMAWYSKMVGRELGLPNARMDKKHLKDCLERVFDLLKDQIEYHKTNTERCHRIETRLHWAGIFLLAMTLIACFLHVLPNLVHVQSLRNWGLVLTFLCGFFPALGASLAGINNQGEFRRIEKRSDAMLEQLEKLKDQTDLLIQALESPQYKECQQFSGIVAELAGNASELMITEVLDWRVVFLDRPLNPPA